MSIKNSGLLLFILILLVSQNLSAKPTFEQYLADLKIQAFEQGYTTDFVDQVFADVSYHKKVVTADKNQPVPRPGPVHQSYWRPNRLCDFSAAAFPRSYSRRR